MYRRSVFGTLKFIFLTVLILVLTFSAVAVTVMNLYKPNFRVSINGDLIGYFANRQQFDEAYDTLVQEKAQVSSNVKVYLEQDPVFEQCYIRDSLLSGQNVYTNLRAELKSEYTIFDVAVNGESKMTFTTEGDANKYAADLKNQVSKLNIEVKPKKVETIGETTTVERADAILKDIVSRNKPVVIPKVTINRNYTQAKDIQVNVSQELANAAAAQGGIWPTTSRYVSSYYGWRGSSFHTGTDIAGRSGDPIYSYKSGVVTFAGWAGGYGYLIKVDHGNGVSSWYGHNRQILVNAGDSVSQGQKIGLMGSTGYSTGNHCHFEIRLNGSPVNSYPYIAGR